MFPPSFFKFITESRKTTAMDLSLSSAGGVIRCIFTLARKEAVTVLARMGIFKLIQKVEVLNVCSGDLIPL